MKLNISIGGLALVTWRSGLDGAVLLMDCEEHVPTLLVPLALIDNRREISQKAPVFGSLNTMLSPEGDVLLAVPLDGCTVDLPGSGGVTADASGYDKSWCDVRRALDFNFLVAQPLVQHPPTRAIVRFRKGRLSGTKPKAPWMTTTSWQLTAPDGKRREHPLTDHLLLEIELANEHDAKITFTKGQVARIILHGGVSGEIGLSLFSLCPFKARANEIEDARDFAPLFGNADIANPVDVSAMETRGNPFCPPGIYQEQ